MSLSGPLLTARGKPEKEFSRQFITVAVAVICYMAAVRHSVLMLSWVVLAVYLFRFSLLTQAANREIEGRWRDLFATVVPGALLALLSAVAARLTSSLLPPLPPAEKLVLVVGVSMVVTLLCFASFMKPLLRPIFRRSPQLATLIPDRFQHFVAH
jgi:hypothetical protein